MKKTLLALLAATTIASGAAIAADGENSFSLGIGGGAMFLPKKTDSYSEIKSKKVTAGTGFINFGYNVMENVNLFVEFGALFNPEYKGSATTASYDATPYMGFSKLTGLSEDMKHKISAYAGLIGAEVSVYKYEDIAEFVLGGALGVGRVEDKYTYSTKATYTAAVVATAVTGTIDKKIKAKTGLAARGYVGVNFFLADVAKFGVYGGYSYFGKTDDSDANFTHTDAADTTKTKTETVKIKGINNIGGVTVGAKLGISF